MSAQMTSTPSSASRIQATTIENAFPTPPNHDESSDSLFRIKARMSPISRKVLQQERAQSTPPELTHSTQFGILTRNADAGLSEVTSLETSWQKLHLSRKKSQYYEGAFACRESNNAAEERVAKDSVVLADLKLNRQLASKKDFLIDLSFRLSEIYQRPASCIMAMVSTDVAMLLGGSSELAYHLTITALSSEIAATKNKRSTHLIQEFMCDALDIPAKRGVVQFEAVCAENLATNGKTTLQEIEHLARQSTEEDSVLRAFSRQSLRKCKRSAGTTLTDRLRTGFPPLRTATPSYQCYTATGLDETTATDTTGPGRKRFKPRQSILAFFRK